MKGFRFLVVVIMAALVLPAAIAACVECSKMWNDWPNASIFTQAWLGSPLPDLSESAPKGSPSAPGEQTDNATVTVSSGGAVQASFTVVPQPASNQEKSMEAESQATPNSQGPTAGHVSPESDGLTLRWVLLIAASSVWIAAICVFAFLCFRGKWQTGSQP